MAAAELSTTVVNLQYHLYDVYIGRANRSRGLRETKWANLFRIGGADPYHRGKKITRARAIELYTQYILDRPDLVQDCKRELKGKRLGCWCWPRACHGDVLVGIAEGLIETAA